MSDRNKDDDDDEDDAGSATLAVAVSQLGRRKRKASNRSAVIARCGNRCFKSTVRRFFSETERYSAGLRQRFTRAHGERTRNGYKRQAANIRRELRNRNRAYTKNAVLAIDAPVAIDSHKIYVSAETLKFKDSSRLSSCNSFRANDRFYTATKPTPPPDRPNALATFVGLNPLSREDKLEQATRRRLLHAQTHVGRLFSYLPRELALLCHEYYYFLKS